MRHHADAPLGAEAVSALAELSTHGFRNLADATWAFGPGSHLIVGPNGAGKSSLLEAVYLLATTRSFRAPGLKECIVFGGERFALRGEVEGPARVELEVGYGPAGPYRRANGRETSLAEHLGALAVVVWTASEGEILRGGPEHRRRLLDRGLVSGRPGDLALLRRYREVLGQKRRLLASGGKGLDAWNAALAGAASAVAERRARYVEALGTQLAEIASGEAGGGLPPLELRYRPSPPQALAGEGAIVQALSVLEGEERERHQPLAGPHRDELEIAIGGRVARRFASAGERKAAGLLLTAAQGRCLEKVGRRPIYLLDDLDAELDPARLRTLWGLFAGRGQVVAGSSRPEAWQGVPVERRVELREGRFMKTEVLSFQ